MYRNLNGLISIVLILTLIPISAFATYPTCVENDNVIVSDDMQDYEIDSVVSSSDGFVQTSTTQAFIVKDDVSLLKGNDNIAVKVNYGKSTVSNEAEFAKRVVVNDSTAFVSLADANVNPDKDLYIKSEIYIPSSTVETLGNGEIRLGAILDASTRPVGPHGYIYKNSDGNLVMKIGPGQAPTQVNYTEYDIPVDEWFEITTKLYFEEWTSGNAVFGEMFLNGEPLSYNGTSKLKCVGYFSKNNRFGAYSLKLVSKTEESSDDTIVYVDNINVWQMQAPLVIECSVQDGDRYVSTDDIQLAFNDKVEIQSVIDALKIYDENQELVTDCDVSVDFTDDYNATLDIVGLKGNKQYTLKIVGLTSVSERKTVTDFVVSFTTKKGDNIYTDIESEDFNLSFGEAQGIADAESAQIALPIIITDGNVHSGYIIATAFDENDNLIVVDVSDFELSSSEIFSDILLEGLDAKASCIKVFVLDKNDAGNFKLIHDPDTFPQITQSSCEATVFPQWPDTDVRVDDAVKSTLKISGTVADSDASKFAFAVITAENTDTLLSEILNNDILAASYDAINADGEYVINNIGFKMPMETYYAYVITENGIIKKEFNYVSVDEAVSVIKDINENNVAKEQICDKIKEYNDAFGIDFVNNFQTERDINILNETVDKNRNTLSGPDNDDYITQLIQIVNNAIDEIAFLNELEQSDWVQIIDCLKDNVKYNNIDVLKLDELTLLEREQLSAAFYNKNFLTSLAVKELYDTTIDKIIAQRNANTDKDAKDELKMIAGDNVVFSEHMQGNTHDTAASEEQRFFSTAKVSALYKNDEIARKRGVTNTAILVNFGKASSSADLEFSRKCADRNVLVPFAEAGIDTNRDIYVQAKVYIPADTVNSLGNGQIRMGTLLNASERPLAPNGYIYKNDSGKLVMAIGPGQQPSTTNVTEHEVPVDEWFTLTYKLYFEEWKTGSAVNGEVMLNGTPLMHNGGSKLKCYGYFDKSNTFGGFSLRLSGKTAASIEDTKVYVDDISIWQRKLEINSSISDGDKYVSTDNIKLDFNDAVSTDNLKKAISVLDKDGNVYTEAKIEIAQDNPYTSILAISGLKTYKNYTLRISDLASNNGRKSDSIKDIKFLTKKSDSLYSDTLDSDFEINYGIASNIEEADVVNVSIPLVNPDGKTHSGIIILAAYNDKDTLVAKNIEPYTINANKECKNISLSGLDSKANSIKIIILDENGVIHSADTFPQSEKDASQEAEYPLWPEFEVKLADVKTSKLKAYSKITSSLSTKNVLFVISADEIDTTVTNVETYLENALAISEAEINPDGTIVVCNVGFDGFSSDTYYAYMIAGNNIVKKQFSYNNLDDVVNVIKAIKDMEEADIYSSLSQVKGGLDSSIDVTLKFTNKRDIDIVNKRIFQKKATLVGPEKVDYIDQLKTVVDFADGEVKFLDGIKALEYWSGVLPYLKENVVYTNISFSKANGLIGDEQRVLANAVMGKVFQNGEAVKSFVEAKVLDIISNRSNNSSISGGGGGGGGAGGAGVSTKPSTQVIFQQDTDITQTTTETIMGFADMTNHRWAAKAVTNLVKKGIVNGVDSKHFAPERAVTREEFVKLTVCALGIFKEDNVECNFDDVNENDWFYPYVSFAAKNSIINGISENAFGTGRNISRQDMMVMIYNALIESGYKLSASKEDFADFDTVSDYAKKAVSSLAGDGVISGRGGNMIVPSETATRAEAAVFINNVVEKYLN